MPKTAPWILAVTLVAGLLAAPALGDAQATTIAIEIAPSVLNLESSGVWVTVHADIPASRVEGFSVTLNGVPVDVVKADSHGDLVAKFPLDDVKAILEPGTVALTMVGETVDGETFSGTKTIRVVRVKNGR